MTQRTYQLYRYQIPVDSQLVLRQRFLKQREGLLVNIRCGEKSGWGEIAPLPEFSQESLDEALEQTKSWLVKWDKARSNNQFMPMEGLYPSVAFGLSCALAEMHHKLNLEADYKVAPLCYGDPDELFAKLEHLEGEKVAKIKVGMYEANRDGLIVNMLLEAIPDLVLRLDANRSWNMAKALQFFKYLKPEHIDRIQFLEEPCKTPAESLEFAEQTKINIAWDESLRAPSFQLQAHLQVSHIVIKPTLTGSLEQCVALIKQAHDLGMQTVISSAIESSFGLTQLARIAKQYTYTTSGLDTLNLMDYQLVRPWQGSSLPIIDLLDTKFIQAVN